MRTFSRLRQHCAYPLTLDALTPRRPRRDAAASIGTEFHAWVDGWVRSGLSVLDGASKQVHEWGQRMIGTGWTPPRGCRSEWALGLTDHALRGVECEEIAPHVYRQIVNVDGPDYGTGSLVTAGRVDLAWIEPGDVDLLHVADIKTGSSYLGPPAKIPQLAACALAARWVLQAPFPLRVGIYYARLGLWDWETIESETELTDVVAASLALPDEPRPGGWCLGCWSKENCEKFPGKDR